MFRLLLLVCHFLPICGFGQRAPNAERLSDFLDEAVADNKVFQEGITGFHLYDIDAERTLYGYNEERRFVPASNVKLLTFFLAHRMLGKWTPAAFYRRHPDRIELWGTGYPLLLHPQFAGYDALGAWLRDQTLPVTVHLNEASEPSRYGAGWSWDDYDYGYVYERTGMPVYGNRLYLDAAPPNAYGQPQFYGSPPSIAGGLVQDEEQERYIHREERSNVFTVSKDFTSKGRFPVQRALITSPALTYRQLRTAFGSSKIDRGRDTLPGSAGEIETLKVPLPDTLYRRLLQNSDNFLAEQLILQCAASRYGTFEEDQLFDYATDTLFAGMGMGRLRYDDGSGLSRYNLLQPKQLTKIVTALHNEVGSERLMDLLPAGGGSGTLKRRFDNRVETYVWAKTGSLSGVICLSGLLRTKSGRWLAFSFLHNNVLSSSRAYYREMERVLGGVYDAL